VELLIRDCHNPTRQSYLRIVCSAAILVNPFCRHENASSSLDRSIAASEFSRLPVIEHNPCLRANLTPFLLGRSDE
jgi:hypothetical protein